MSTAPAINTETVHHIRGWQRLTIWPLGFITRLLTASLHFEASDESLRNLTKIDRPVAFILWHNRLSLVGEIFKRYRHGRRVHGLVSASKDGAWLAAFFDLIGIGSVRGSSSTNARESVNLLVHVMREGSDIGITPDGPRGPIYDFKGGGVIVARRAKAPVLLVGAEFERAWRLRSWDRFYIPHPFSRVRLHCRLITPAQLASRDVTVESLGKQLANLNPEIPTEPAPTIY